MIPHVLHYCWFGGGRKTDLMRTCMESWDRYCQGFDFVEWNESSVDIARLPRYVREAMDRGKWAFVSDYVRLMALRECGGVYLDVDVELLGPIDDLVDGLDGFAGFDFDGRNVNTGLGIGARAGDPMISEMMGLYDQLQFELPNGTLFMLANTFICTPVLVRHGLVQDNSLQRVGDFTVFPREYFCPKTFSYARDEQELHVTQETRSIHHYALSWVNGEDERAYCESSEEAWVDAVNKLTGVQMVPNYRNGDNSAAK